MHKLGLKLWNINTDYYYEEARRLYNMGIFCNLFNPKYLESSLNSSIGFDYIELYIVPGHIDLINKWKELDIPYDIHAPHSLHNMNLSISKFEKSNLEMYYEVKTYADKLNSSVIVFHGGANGDIIETTKEINSFNDSRIIIENKPYRHKKASDLEFFVGSKISEIKYILENSSCGFCLDVGHAIAAANFQKIEPYEYIKEFLNINPKRIHLSDININNKFDEHLNFGDGTLDFNKVFNMLNNNTPITIETAKKSKFDLEDFVQDALFLKCLMENI